MKDEQGDEMSRSALAAFRVKEEEIERKKMEIMEKVHTQLDQIEEAGKRLTEIHGVSYVYINV